MRNKQFSNVPKFTLACVFSVFGAAAAYADTFVETFDNNHNEGQWSFGTGQEFIRQSGGNPGAYLYEPGVDTFAPQPHTTFGVGSEFTGDYRARRVTHVGIDLILHHVDFSAKERPLTLILVSDNNTPTNQNDDWGAYFIGPDNVPLEGEGWKSYRFDVPSQEEQLPDGWRFIALGDESPTPDWNRLITDVGQVRYFYGDPEFFFIFQVWELGLDNPSIVCETAGVAELTNIAILDGVIVSGGLDELRTSDNEYLETEARVTGEAHQPHLLRMRITADSDVQTADEITLRIEGRITDVEAQTTLRLRDWANNRFVHVDRYSMTFSESAHEVTVPDAARFLRASDGLIRLEFEQIVILPFTLNGFHTLLDHVEISAR